MTTALDEALAQVHTSGDLSPLVAAIPYARFLGVEGALVDGQPLFVLPYAERLIGNPTLPALHGGVTAAFMENAALMHVALALAEPRLPKGVDFSIDYLRSARAKNLHAACTVARQGKRVAQVQVECWQDERERPVALARGHFLLVDPSTMVRPPA